MTLLFFSAIVGADGDHAGHACRRGVVRGERSPNPASSHGLPELKGASDRPARTGTEGIGGGRQEFSWRLGCHAERGYGQAERGQSLRAGVVAGSPQHRQLGGLFFLGSGFGCWFWVLVLGVSFGYGFWVLGSRFGFGFWFWSFVSKCNRLPNVTAFQD